MGVGGAWTKEMGWLKWPSMSHKRLRKQLITKPSLPQATALNKWMKWKIDLVSCDLCLCHVQIETSAHWIKRGHKAVWATAIKTSIWFTVEAPPQSNRRWREEPSQPRFMSLNCVPNWQMPFNSAAWTSRLLIKCCFLCKCKKKGSYLSSHGLFSSFRKHFWLAIFFQNYKIHRNHLKIYWQSDYFRNRRPAPPYRPT